VRTQQQEYCSSLCSRLVIVLAALSELVQSLLAAGPNTDGLLKVRLSPPTIARFVKKKKPTRGTIFHFYFHLINVLHLLFKSGIIVLCCSAHHPVLYRDREFNQICELLLPVSCLCDDVMGAMLVSHSA